jgi:hypothetical protein
MNEKERTFAERASDQTGRMRLTSAIGARRTRPSKRAGGIDKVYRPAGAAETNGRSRVISRFQKFEFFKTESKRNRKHTHGRPR